MTQHTKYLAKKCYSPDFEAGIGGTRANNQGPRALAGTGQRTRTRHPRNKNNKYPQLIEIP